jgi:hypothetical protein
MTHRIWKETKTLRRRHKQHLGKLTAPYKELIAKTTQKPPETKTTIETEILEDLAKNSGNRRKTNTPHCRRKRTHILHNGQQHKIPTQNKNLNQINNG